MPPVKLDNDDDDDTRVTVLLEADAKVSKHMNIPDGETWLRRLPDRKLRVP